MNQTLDYYRILQVNYGANKADITEAYRRLCKQYHPDINTNPAAEELMKQINLAYSALCAEKPAANGQQKRAGEWKQRQAEAERACACIQAYFAALLSGDYVKAYNSLSDYDKRYVTLQSFCEWRKSVQKLFAMREFSIKTSGHIYVNRLKDGTGVPAIRHMVSITEKNTVLQTIDSYQVSKLAIMEQDRWCVFLGYRDLNEIAKIFEDLSVEQEKGEMTKHWEEYCSSTCRNLNMLSQIGFLKEAKRELYRCKRYKQQMTLACFRVKPVSITVSDELVSEALESASRILTTSLRETDIPAYLGDGVFAVLFVELRKRHAPLITQRIVNKLKSGIHKDIRMSFYSDCNFEVYDGGDLAESLDRCSRFKK